MEQLIYISTARTRVDEAQLADILAVSRYNNARDGLTGLLIVGGQRFMQVLEGPGGPLTRAIGRIERDPRHFAIVRLDCRRIERPAFPSWHMGHSGAAAARGATLASMIERLTDCVQDPHLRAELRGFAAIHDRAAA